MFPQRPQHRLYNVVYTACFRSTSCTDWCSSGFVFNFFDVNSSRVFESLEHEARTLGHTGSAGLRPRQGPRVQPKGVLQLLRHGRVEHLRHTRHAHAIMACHRHSYVYIVYAIPRGRTAYAAPANGKAQAF